MPATNTADTGAQPTGPKPISIQDGVGLLLAEADPKQDTRRRPEPEPAANDNAAGAQGEDVDPRDTPEIGTEEDEPDADPAEGDEPDGGDETDPLYAVKIDGKET